MKAAVCNAANTPLVIEEVTLDGPADNQVKVRVRACAICHSDVALMRGAWGSFEPSVFGHEISGTVSEVGPNVADVAVGDTVIVGLVRHCGTCRACRAGQPVLCSGTFDAAPDGALSGQDGRKILQGLQTGGFAEMVVVDRSQVVVIPDDIPPETAAVIACAVLTGVGAVLNTARLPAHKNVVVIGAGGVGLNSVQAAALKSPQALIAVDISSHKLDVAKQFGATDLVNASDTDPVVAVTERTDGVGADFVFVTVGNPQAAEQAIAMCARGGTVVLVGMPPNGANIDLDISSIAHNEVHILGSKMGSAVPERDIPQIIDLYKQGDLRLDELVTGRYGLDDINDAVVGATAPDAIRNVILF